MTDTNKKFNQNNYDSSRDRSRSGYRGGSRDRHESRDKNRSRYRGGSRGRNESRSDCRYERIDGRRDKMIDDRRDKRNPGNKWYNISENIILKNESQENKKEYIDFIEKYAEKNYKGFSNLCGYIMKNDIKPQTIANFVNKGAKLLRNNSFNEENDSDTFKQIAKKIAKLLITNKYNLDKFTSQAIANTFNGLAKCGVNLGKYVNNDFIKALVGRIQTLLNETDSKSEEQFNFKSQELANTFNGLAQCGVNLGGYIDGTFIEALVGRIQTLLNKTDSEEQFNFKSQELANTFNGLGQCGVNLDEYFKTKEGEDSKNAFIRALVGRIKDLLKDFNSIGIANTFNGLAKCGVNLGEYLNTLKSEDKNKFIRALVDRIQTLLKEKDFKKQFNSIGIANTFNGLGQCGVNLGEYLNKSGNEKLKYEFIGALVDRIQNLLKDFNSIGIANTFNGLAKCGVNLDEYFKTKEGEDSKNAFIRALVGRIKDLLNKTDSEEQFNFKSQELANTFNGLGQCGVNLDGYLKDKFIEALVGRIQTLLNKTDSEEQFNFKSQELANTFNGLGQCGVNLDEYFKTKEGEDSKNAFIRALVGRIKDLLKDFNSIGIANTFNGLGQCGVNLDEYFKTKEGEDSKNAFIGALVNRIQVLLNKKDSQIRFNFKSQELANIFNGLAKGGINLGGYVDNTFIKALVDKIQILLNKTDSEEQFNFKSQELANTFNGLAKCGVNLGEYLNKSEKETSKDAFIGTLVGRIKTLLEQEQFTSQHIANTFNGLGQCGVNLDEYLNTLKSEDKNKFIGALVDRIQTLLNKTDSEEQFNFKSQELANTFNGLVKLFLYNEDLYKKNISHFKDIINNLVQKYFKQSNRDNRSDWAMLYNIKYLQVCDFKINEEILSKIKTNLKLSDLNDDHTNSTLERNFETFLGNFGLKNKKTETLERKDDCYESESELTFQVTSHVSFKRLIDFYIEFIQDNKTYNKTYKAYIELDGPIHFTDTEQTQKTPQTQIRDILTLKRLQEEQADDNTQILYVTLSANEFDKIKESITTEKEDLIKFLINKDQLKQITEKTFDTSKMVDEDKLAHSSVNGVASKMTDTNDYITLTSRQAVSELAQKAQQDDSWITVKSNHKGKQKDKKTKTKTKSRKIFIK